MKNLKRIFAILGVACLVFMLCLLMFSAFYEGDNKEELFRVSLGLVIMVPVLSYICMMAVRLWGNRRVKETGMIKNIIFDIGNVLMDFGWQEYLKSYGYPEEAYEKIADATFRSEQWNQRDKGDFPEETYVAEFIKAAPEYEKEIREVVDNTWKSLKIRDYTVTWVKYLSEKGYHLYVLSNYSRHTLDQTIGSMAFIPYMEGVVFSCEEKEIKPEPAIYKILLKRYDLKPEECVFLDDRADNCQAARDLGMHAICFESFQQAVAALEKLGVK